MPISLSLAEHGGLIPHFRVNRCRTIIGVLLNVLEEAKKGAQVLLSGLADVDVNDWAHQRNGQLAIFDIR